MEPHATRTIAVQSRGPALFAIATLGTNLANFAFHAVASRSLGPADYSALTAFLVIATVITVPLAAMQISMTRALVRGTLSQEALEQLCTRAALAVGGSWVVMSPLIALTLRVETRVAALMAGYIAAAVFAVAPKAALLSRDRLSALGCAALLGASMRVGLGWVLLHAGGGLGAAIGVGAIAEALTVAALVRTRRPAADSISTCDPHAREAHAVTVLAIGSIWTMLATDVFLARLFMDPTVAGLYAGTALIARSTFFVPQALTSAMFPRLVKLRGTPDVVKMARILVLGSSFAGIVVVLTATPLVSAILLGGYPIDRATLGVLCGQMLCLALANLKVHQAIATGHARVAGPWMIVIIGSVLASAVATDPRRLAFAVLGISTVYLLVVSLPRRLICDPRIASTELPLQEVEVTAVVPVFNESQSVVAHLRRLSTHLDRSVKTFEIIAVDDGSTDGSPSLIASAELAGVRLVTGPHQGKGAALRKGMRLGRGRYIGFIDADGDIPADCFTRLIRTLVASEADGVVAIRHRQSPDDRSLLRRLGSTVVSRLVLTTLSLDVTDTQAGVKIFRRSLVRDVLPLCKETGFAFDGELLAFGKHILGARFSVVPVDVTWQSGSTVRLRDAARILTATMRIRLAISDAKRIRRPIHLPAQQVLEPAAS